MRILMTGGTGFIGTALVTALRESGHQVLVLSRVARADVDESLRYVRALDQIDGAIDAVINLAGASLADRRWTDAYKRELRDSRIGLTERLGVWMRDHSQQPSVMLSASAIGFYGAGGDSPFDEESPAGEGFSASLCADWEDAARAAAPSGCRLCIARLGVVFDREGGAYSQMARPFRLRMGNWIGSGRQWLSWVHRSDVVAALRLMLGDSRFEGVVNVTAPEPVTSRGFCDAMQVQHQSLLTLPAPAAVMRLVFGEMAEELLISGQRVLPKRLMEADYAFQYPDLPAALAVLEAP